MKEFNLYELLRYCFAGIFFLIILFLSFKAPEIQDQKSMILGLYDGNQAVLAAAILLLSLSIGGLIYSLHRAVPFAIIDWLFFRYKRKKKRADQCLIRWKNLNSKKALQHRMIEWASQIHFLYCVSWAGFFAFLVGIFGRLQTTRFTYPLLIVSIFILLITLFYHCKYHEYENRVFKEDIKNRGSNESTNSKDS
jgi:hypothetical protein